MGRDGPGSWLPLGTSAWLCGKDRWGPGGVESISEDCGFGGLGVVGMESQKNVRGLARRFDGSQESWALVI